MHTALYDDLLIKATFTQSILNWHDIHVNLFKIGKFTKSKVMELCPTISKASVENPIKQLVEQGLLLKHGNGRSTFYTRSDI